MSVDPILLEQSLREQQSTLAALQNNVAQLQASGFEDVTAFKALQDAKQNITLSIQSISNRLDVLLGAGLPSYHKALSKVHSPLEVKQRLIALCRDSVCTKKRLTVEDEDANLALMYFVEHSLTEVALAILDNPQCDREIIHQTNRKNDFALLSAAYMGDLQVAKAILYSKNFAASDLEQVNQAQNSALILAACFDRLAVVQAILNHPFCSKTLLMQQDTTGFSPLIWAAAFNLDSVAKAILDSQYCDMEVIELRDDEGKSALDIANEPIKSMIKQKIEALQLQEKGKSYSTASTLGRVSVIYQNPHTTNNVPRESKTNAYQLRM